MSTSLVVPYVGEVGALNYITGKVSNGNLKLHLYNNNHAPASGDTLGSYTETSATGYSAATLTGSSWTNSTTSNVTTGTYPAVTFTITSSDTLYGYFVTDASSSTLMWAQAFDVPFAYGSAGGSVTVTPVLGAV